MVAHIFFESSSLQISLALLTSKYEFPTGKSVRLTVEGLDKIWFHSWRLGKCKSGKELFILPLIDLKINITEQYVYNCIV